MFEDLSIVVLVYNRRQALEHTLGKLEPIAREGAQVIVVDNASADGSGEACARIAPHAKLLTLEQNLGVAGFNRGAARATRPFLLILDDDAWPEPAGLAEALAMMRAEPGVGGVMLHRLHPRTGEYEWPFDRVAEHQRHWPDMGCGNLVRTDLWHAIGGYEERFFLYRNDTDCALKLAAAGAEVRFDPRWRVLHDSPTVRRQRPRWFRLSTRNWVWMCRRHGKGAGRLRAIVMGWLWAHKLAGFSVARQWQALRGFVEGVTRAAPPLEPGLEPDGAALARLVSLKRRYRRSRATEPRDAG